MTVKLTLTIFRLKLHTVAHNYVDRDIWGDNPDTPRHFYLCDVLLWDILGAGLNFLCPLISLLSADPLIDGTALIFHLENINLTECLF